MSTEPTKRSDGPAEKPRCDHHWVAHLQPDLPDPVRSVEVCSLCGTINGAELAYSLEPLLAALAASRADNDRLRDEMARRSEQLRERLDDLGSLVTTLTEESDQFEAERDAARVEVSQLRAKTERVEALAEEMSNQHGQCWNSIFARLVRAALAEPLGSTEDGGAA